MLTLDSNNVFMLLAEDSDADIDLFRRALADSPMAGSEFVAVPTVARVLEELPKHNFEAVLVDLSLPDAKGVDGVSRIRVATKLPLIVITGNIDAKVAEESGLAGADGFLVKDGLTGLYFEQQLRAALGRRQFANDQEREKARAKSEHNAAKYEEFTAQNQRIAATLAKLNARNPKA